MNRKHVLTITLLVGLLVGLMPLGSVFAQGDGGTAMEPFLNEDYLISGIRPQGWEQPSPGMFISPDGLTVLLEQAYPGMQENVIEEIFIPNLELDVFPDASGEYTTEYMVWDTYIVVYQGAEVNIALSEGEDRTYIMALFTEPDTHAAMYNRIYLPALEAYRPDLDWTEMPDELPIDFVTMHTDARGFSLPISGVYPAGWRMMFPGTYTRSFNDLDMIIQDAITAEAMIQPEVGVRQYLEATYGITEWGQPLEDTYNGIAWRVYLVASPNATEGQIVTATMAFGQDAAGNQAQIVYYSRDVGGADPEALLDRMEWLIENFAIVTTEDVVATSELVLVPYVDNFGFSTVVPEGWFNEEPGKFVAPDENSQIIMVQQADSFAELVSRYEGLLTFDSVPPDIGEYAIAGFNWAVISAIYTVESGEMGTAIAVTALPNGNSIAIGIDAAAHQFPYIFDNVFVPAVESFALTEGTQK